MVILTVGSVLYVSLSVFAAKLTTCQNLRKKIYVIFVFFSVMPIFYVVEI